MKIFRENIFLTYCSRAEIDEKIKGQLANLVLSNLKWDTLIDKARLQGVAQFLYYHLSKMPEIWSIIPQEGRDSLKQFYYSILAKNYPLQIELKKVISSLNEAQIPVIVLKGAALLETVYKNIGWRPILSDVDLLVKKEDMLRVKSILQEAGYQKATNLSEESREKFGGEFHLYKEGGLFLDIHIALSPHERFRDILGINQDPKIWTESKTYNTSAGELRVLGPAHLIIHLCMHLAIAHSFCGLFHFCDIRESILTYRAEINWKELIIKAKYYKLKTIIYYALLLSEDLYGPLVDKEVLAALRPNKLHLAFINLFINKGKILSLPDGPLGYEKYIIQLFLMDNFIDMIKVIGKSFFPSKEWLRYKYSIKNKYNLLLYRIGHPFIFIFRMARA